MTYFQLGDIDFSHYVNELKIKRGANYNAQTNAAGDTVVDYINHKVTLEVGFVPLDMSEMYELYSYLDNFTVSITFYDPQSVGSRHLTTIECIVPTLDIEYYTIQSEEKTLFKPFTLKFTQL